MSRTPGRRLPDRKIRLQWKIWYLMEAGSAPTRTRRWPPSALTPPATNCAHEPNARPTPTRSEDPASVEDLVPDGGRVRADADKTLAAFRADAARDELRA